MVLNININDITKPVIRESNNGSFFTRLLRKYLEKCIKKRFSKLNKVLDNTLLKIEGTHEYLKRISPDEAVEILPDIKNSISLLEKEYEIFEKENFHNYSELKSKYKYLLKSMYKSEAIATKISYRNQKFEKNEVDRTIKEGIIKMNSHYFKKSI